MSGTRIVVRVAEDAGDEMHECPDCGQACYCHGNIDDCVFDAAYCSHDCEPNPDDDFDQEAEDREARDQLRGDR